MIFSIFTKAERSKRGSMRIAKSYCAEVNPIPWVVAGLSSCFAIGVCLFLSCSQRNIEVKNNLVYHSEVISYVKEEVFVQVIVVVEVDKSTSPHTGLLYGMEYIENSWITTFDTVPCNLGRGGIAKIDAKKEGDGKTPGGKYLIGSAFGYSNDLNPTMSFLQLQDEHYWVCDTKSPLYNTLVYGLLETSCSLPLPQFYSTHIHTPQNSPPQHLYMHPNYQI